MSPRQLIRSAPFRLALAYVALFSVSSIVLLAFIYWSTAGSMVAQAEETIEAEISGLAERYRLTGLGGLVDLVEARASHSGAGSSLYLLVDPGYHHIAGNLQGWPAAQADEKGWIRFKLEDRRDETNQRVHEARAKIFPLRGEYRILVGRDFHDIESIQRRIVSTLAWGLAITAALALIGGALVGRSRIRRLAEINRTIGEIMAGNLSRRIPRRRAGDEFDRLSTNLNKMLDEIQRLMDGVRQVSDSIAHDLRTPLARLRNQLELLHEAERDEEKRRAVELAIQDAENLLTTFTALLRIAQIESGARREGFAELDLPGLLKDVAEYYEPLAEERSQTLRLVLGDWDGPVSGDRDLLFQALANLVDNAVKYAPSGGRITLGLESEGGRARITVADSGAGIPRAHRQRVFERFYRVDGSRNTPGNGLGLSLVEAVIRLHGGEIRLEDNAPGLRVLILL